MPASFIVQDDTGLVANANAYISLAFYRQYHLDRGRDTSATVDADAQVAIIKATDYTDNRWRLRFAGRPLEEEQTTEWPRSPYFTDTGKEVTGLPVKLQQAVAEYALRAVTSDLVVDGPLPIVGGEQQPTGQVLSASVTVGPITDAKTYAEGAGGFGTGTILVDGCLFRVIPAGDMLIEYLLKFQSRQRRVIRA